MRDANAARFSGILNVGFSARAPENGAFVSRYCIAAARKTAKGRVRLFAGDLVTPGRNNLAACKRNFEKWLSAEQLLQEAEDPNGWTQVNTFTSTHTSLSGDQYSRTSAIYRANTTDPANDYFMFIQQNDAQAASNAVVASTLCSYGEPSAAAAACERPALPIGARRPGSHRAVASQLEVGCRFKQAPRRIPPLERNSRPRDQCVYRADRCD